MILFPVVRKFNARGRRSFHQSQDRRIWTPLLLLHGHPQTHVMGARLTDETYQHLREFFAA